MSDIIIDLNGILKLLTNLKTNKATGPDEIKPIVLKELRNEISPVIQTIRDESFITSWRGRLYSGGGGSEIFLVMYWGGGVKIK